MNVLHGRLERADGLQLGLGDGLRIALAGSEVPDAWLGQPVTVGIRPEGVRVAGQGEAGFDAEVEVAEPVGSDVFVNLRVGPQALVARLGPETHPTVGSRLGLVLQPQALHVFDRESGLRRALAA